MSTTTHQTPPALIPPAVVSREAWLAARLALLEKEKKHTREGDALAEERRRLPWVRMEAPYVFETRQGRASLADLFAGRSQLAMYHFMFHPDWDEGCRSCSVVAEHLDAAAVHLAQRDVTVVLASRAPLERIEPFRQRMGWTLPWVSTFGSTFNADFGVTYPESDVSAERRTYNFGTAVPFSEEVGGASFFARDAAGAVYHTYSTYGRGGEPLMLFYFILDRVPRGRDEAGLPWTTAWLRHKDRYGAEPDPAGS